MKRADSVARYATHTPRFATLILLMALLPLLAFGQRKNKWGNSINVSTSFNYHSATAPYCFFNELGVQQLREIELTYLTRNSGTFVESGEVDLIIEREREISLPTPVVSLGASVQTSCFMNSSLSRTCCLPMLIRWRRATQLSYPQSAVPNRCTNGLISTWRPACLCAMSLRSRSAKNVTPDLNWVIGLHLRYVVKASERR